MMKSIDSSLRGRSSESAGQSRSATGNGTTSGTVGTPNGTARSGFSTGEADLPMLSAVDAVRALVHGDITAESYASALIRQCSAGASLNAFITLRPEHVLEAARECDRKRSAGAELGCLHGLPIAIKDSVNTRDFPTTAGTAALRHFQPREDAPLVRKLRDRGAIVLGKNNMHELSWGYTSTNEAYGAVRNPYDPSRIPGGSSGGTAVSIAHRMAALGVAEDTEGSIRVPAALCGIVGFRPTTGRYPNAGTAPTTPLFDQLGPHARTVADVVLFDAALTGRSAQPALPSLKGIRLGVIRSYFWTELDPEVERITEAALETVRSAGVDLVEGDLPELPRLMDAITLPVQYHDFRPAMTRYLADYCPGVSFEQLIAQASPDLRRMMAHWLTPDGRGFVRPERYREILNVRLPAVKTMYRTYFQRSGVSAIVFPATSMPAPTIERSPGRFDRSIEIGGRRVRLDEAISRNIGPASTTGLPSLVLPAGLTRGKLPVALEIDGPVGSDQKLLCLGLALEAELGRLPPPPTVCGGISGRN